MSDFDHLVPIIRELLDEDIIVGPALSNVGIGGLNDEIYRVIQEQADHLTNQLAPKPIQYPRVTLPRRLIQNALCEALCSTSAYYSHLWLGYLNIDESMVLVSMRLIERFIQNHSHDDVVSLIFVVHRYDNYQVLNHYGQVLESQFLSGELHRPWIRYTLEDELNIMLATGNVQRTIQNDISFISTTNKGRGVYYAIRDFLRETGFIQRRNALMRMSQFGHFQEYDQFVYQLSNVKDIHRKILSTCRIQPGMKVLELGCGTGGMTLDSGLYQLIGADGELIATEPSFGMITRAKEKANRMSVSNVRFERAPAEKLPFDDNSFDAVVGSMFLQFTDIKTALQEIHRVAKPGAFFTTIYALNFPKIYDFFLDWFEPLLASGDHYQLNDILPGPDTVVNAMIDGHYVNVENDGFDIITLYHDSERIVRFLVQVGNFFQSTVNELPWQARQDMIQSLIMRGHLIQEKYSPEQLVQIHPGQFLKAQVRK